MSKVILTKEDEESIINEGVFGIAMNALGRVLGSSAGAVAGGVGAAASALKNVAIETGNHLIEPDTTHPNYDPSSTRNQTRLSSMVQRLNDRNNRNSPNYKPTPNELMMQQIQQQNAQIPQ